MTAWRSVAKHRSGLSSIDPSIIKYILLCLLYREKTYRDHRIQYIPAAGYSFLQKFPINRAAYKVSTTILLPPDPLIPDLEKH